MVDTVYPLPTHELWHKRQELAPKTEEAFRAFSQQVSAVLGVLWMAALVVRETRRMSA